MDCSIAREALSARIDGEREPVPAARVDEHLEVCADCRSWYASASALTRAIRVRPSHRTPDLAPEILAAAGVDIPAGAARRTLRWVLRDHPWRAGLVVVALCQLVLGFGQVLGWGSGHDHASMSDPAAMSGHLFNESTAWNVAVGVGFLVAAARPRATTGLLPVLVAFTAILGIFVVADIMAGQVTVARVSTHAIIAVGVLVTTMVHRAQRRSDTPPPVRSAVARHEDEQRPSGFGRGRGYGHLRDASGPAA
ncbi:zf-HC2 domain-containing protein [Rhodococcus sp. IEGM 1354]|uniref:zf-HC2 domain-containing protein n=1 Tax=Rhodococcus sp. IEGM 1354 TaxID=3047088 RepID=UPI0024B69CC1|nr:zf-HC2 domain-containing protein [Rhodococcus sp. IEGM 1354]